jgi:hypothetical protein
MVGAMELEGEGAKEEATDENVGDDDVRVEITDADGGVARMTLEKRQPLKEDSATAASTTRTD